MWQQLLKDLKSGDIKALARAISFVENEQEGYTELLQSLNFEPGANIVGITGPPGAGKSTLADALVGHMIADGKKIAVLCVDPSSPFNMGAILGDRIRMSSWYNNTSVFIRSLATRGALGGLSPKIIEITDIVKAAGFDLIIIETVGVGQSEVEIAGLADTTIVVMVPEGGDEIQTMKSGLMEVADVFVVNKADRPGADVFVKNLRQMLAPAFSNHKDEIEVLKTSADRSEGIAEVAAAIRKRQNQGVNERRLWLLTDHAYQLIQKRRMGDVSKSLLREALARELNEHAPFNLYRFAARY